MKSAYPTFIKQYKNDYLVYVPDFGIHTEGKSIEDAIYMARDAIGVMGISMQDDNEIIPEPCSYTAAIDKANQMADEDFNFATGLLTLVDVDFDVYRKKNDTRMVKKNCTIPYYLNVEAEKRDINFSKVLQEALLSKMSL